MRMDTIGHQLLDVRTQLSCEFPAVVFLAFDSALGAMIKSMPESSGLSILYVILMDFLAIFDAGFIFSVISSFRLLLLFSSPDAGARLVAFNVEEPCAHVLPGRFRGSPYGGSAHTCLEAYPWGGAAGASPNRLFLLLRRQSLNFFSRVPAHDLEAKSDHVVVLSRSIKIVRIKVM